MRLAMSFKFKKNQHFNVLRRAMLTESQLKMCPKSLKTLTTPYTEYCDFSAKGVVATTVSQSLSFLFQSCITACNITSERFLFVPMKLSTEWKEHSCVKLCSYLISYYSKGIR